MPRETFGAIVREYRRYAFLLLAFVALLIGIEIVDSSVLGHRLDAFGIRPREIEGLLGIPLAPFLHGNLPHVLANASGLLGFGALILFLRGPRTLLWTSIVTVLVSGVGTWLVGAPHSVHIGASGLVFGWLAYVLTIGWYERRFGTLLVSIAALFVFGGMVVGVLPGQVGISWEAHAFGFLGGWLATRGLSRRGKGARESVRSL